MSQNETAQEAVRPKRSFLTHPAFIVIPTFLFLGALGIIAMANANSGEDFTGIATVEHVNGGKRCLLDLRTEDGVFLDNFRMSSDTCKKVTEGDVIEVVKGKQLHEIAE